MKLYSLILVVFLVSLSIIIKGQDQSYVKVAEPESVKQMIKKASVSTTSITSDFTQEKHLTMMEEVLVSKGHFLFKKENKVRWEYIDPINYAIIIEDSRFIIDNDGKISEYDTEVNKLFKEINRMIVMAIQGDFIDNPDFDATIFENSTYYFVLLKPRAELLKDILTSIDIYFLKTDMAVEIVQFNEPGSDFTKTKFTNREVNIEIPNAQFHVN